MSSSPSVTGLLLAPGASAGRDQPALVAIDQAVARLGILVERIDFPYRLAGRRRPDTPAVLVETIVSAARALAARAAPSSDGAGPSSDGAGPSSDGAAPSSDGAGITAPGTAEADGDTESILLGGRSMGGRVCSMAVAADMPAAGLVLVSYPLHPPGRPDKLRNLHFPRLNVPCLFVSGTRDAFASPAELEMATMAIAGRVTHAWLDGDHGLKRRDAEVAALVADWVLALTS